MAKNTASAKGGECNGTAPADSKCCANPPGTNPDPGTFGGPPWCASGTHCAASPSWLPGKLQAYWSAAAPARGPAAPYPRRILGKSTIRILIQSYQMAIILIALDSGAAINAAWAPRSARVFSR